MQKRRELISRIIFLTTFGIAMGFLEAVVVVYLRWLFYPEGFTFPLKLIAFEKLSLEYLREISTIVMLLSLSIITGKNFPERLSCFFYSFGIWDIFYYAWVKVLLNWPSSLLTWDILFLIPVVWVGPVLAPIICSVTMIVTAGCILYFDHKGYPVTIRLYEWILFLSGTFVVFITFIWDYASIIIKGNFIPRFLTLGVDPEFQSRVSHYIPTSYNWYLFALGEVLIFLSLLLFCKRMKSYQRNGTASK